MKLHWSLDSCFGFALKTELFSREDMVCTKTLYNYVNLGLLEKIRNIDLPLKVRRKNKGKRVREHKKKLGRSIEERSPFIEERKEFGHWECDLVIGRRDKDAVFLTMTKRKTRYSFILKLPDKKAATVRKAFDELFSTFGSEVRRVFKSLTTDNGSEFASLSELEKVSNTLVYYAHPYTS